MFEFPFFQFLDIFRCLLLNLLDCLPQQLDVFINNETPQLSREQKEQNDIHPKYLTKKIHFAAQHNAHTYTLDLVCLVEINY